ncbi:MAG: hypothetical protein P8M68_00330 [Aquiluna sp.]|nr:hypothetical protein [Aquiluna sp.]
MLDAFASGFLVFAYLATAAFQLALVFGAPLGEYAFGGNHVGVLPSFYRGLSAVSSLALVAISGHYAAQLGWFDPILGTFGNSVVNWVLFGFAAVQALANNFTKSQKEKRLWSGPTVAMALAAFLVAF